MEMPPSVKSADRVLDLFELLAASGRLMSHTEIADTLGIPKSSLSQLLRNLIARGYVESNGRGHCLGPAFQRIAATASVTRRLPEIVAPILDMLTKETGESSAFNQLAGDDTEVIATVLGPQRLVTHMRLGDTAPLYATSGGKAILAAMPAAFVETYLHEVEFQAATPNTIISALALQSQLVEIGQAGFAYSFEEWTPGIVGMAVAVVSSSDTPLGALNIAVPVQRADAERIEGLGRALRRARDELAQRLAAQT
jgi:DNA-binding IclR family transcriptional regulator